VNFLQEFEKMVERLAGELEKLAKEAVTLLEKHVGDHPELVFAVLRRLKPILVVKGFGLVTRHADVEEVLHHPQEFTVQAYAPKMEAITGPFFLGLDDTPLYERDVSVMRLAARRDDVARIARLVDDTAGQLVSAAAPSGGIDVVAGLADLVPARLVAEYFGAPAPDDATQIRWARILFDEIFINVGNDPAVTGPALAAAAEMRPHLDGLIAARKAELAAGAQGPDDLLGRLLAMQCSPGGRIDDAAIRTNLLGIIVGCIPTTSKAVALAVDELLRRPAELAAASAAAARDDDDLVAAYVFEALRFKPQNIGLFRTTAVDYTLARGTHRATTIPAGTRVLVATQSAMHDPDFVTRPEEFRIDRPPYHYMHFGSGLHSCFGRHINQVQIPRIVKAVLRQPGLRRAEGAAGRLQTDGPYPSSLRVSFGPR